MKTLDEVIKAYEICLNINETSCRGCPYTEFNAEGKWACSLCGDCTEDALSYLKEYRTLQCGYIKAMADLEDNPPLTWEQLTQMEGRPVWIEAESLSVGVSPYWKDWYIIKSFSNDEFMYCNDGFEWAKKIQGRLWQAYGKERK